MFEKLKSVFTRKQPNAAELAAGLDHLFKMNANAQECYEQISEHRLRCRECGFTFNTDDNEKNIGLRIAKHINFYNAKLGNMTAKQWADGFADAIEKEFEGVLGSVLDKRETSDIL